MGAASKKTTSEPTETRDITSVRADVERELAELLAQPKDGVRAAAQCAVSMAKVFPPENPADVPYDFFFLCGSFAISVDCGQMPMRLAEVTLGKMLAFVDGSSLPAVDRAIFDLELRGAMAQVAAADGRYFEAWSHLKHKRRAAAHISPRSELLVIVELGHLFGEAGRLDESLACYQEARAKLAAEPAMTAELAIKEARIHRQAGAFDVAQRTLAAAAAAAEKFAAPQLQLLQLEHEWEMRLLAAQSQGDLGSLVRAVEPKQPWRRFDRCAVAWLAAWRSGNELFTNRLPSLSALGRLLGPSASRRDAAVLLIIESLSAGTPAKLFEALAAARTLPCGDVAQLATSCIAAGLSAAGETDVATSLVAHSPHFSQGQDPWVNLSPGQKRERPQLTAGDFAWPRRLVRTIGFATGTAATIAMSQLRQFNAGEDERRKIRDKAVEAHAARLRKYLPALKGALQKVTQVYQVAGDLLPMPIRLALDDISHRPSVMEPKLVRSTLEKSLGKPLTTVFASFCDAPIRAGTIGQVHRATLLDGTEVAVKVQYPDLKRQVQFNRRAIAHLEPVIGPYLPQLDYKAVLDEVVRIILAELDFEQEASHFERMAKVFEGDRFIKVPGIYRHASSAGVLTMDFAPGLALPDFARQATPAMQATMALTIIDAVYRPFYLHDFGNTDPHPGNFLVDGDVLWILDLGAVQQVDPEVILWDLRCREAVRRQDKERILSLAVQMGIVAADRTDLSNALYDLYHGVAHDILYTNSTFERANLRHISKPTSVLADSLSIPQCLLAPLRLLVGCATTLALLEDGQVKPFELFGQMSEEFLRRQGLTVKDLE